ncbi:heterokaryon incompatibility protein-domain-containing protein, partial [Fusarium redolens]
LSHVKRQQSYLRKSQHPQLELRYAMSLPPPLYSYSSFPEGSIRLLRLLPHQDEHALIQCRLIDCALSDSGSTRPYSALSYVWGSESKPQSISIDGCDLPIGENLHMTLLHLRDRSIERTIWVDAICINQQDPKEKGQQVQSMAKIYAKASCVIVWLGGATPNSGQALEEIRIAAEQRTKRSINENAIFGLLERPWFQRIWVRKQALLTKSIQVLQEVAAARHVLIKCGPTEIDGYAFCLGLSALKLSYETHPDLRPLIRSVSYLIRGAVFRHRCAISRSGRFSLDIYHLGGLVDMYHTRQATDRRDKVYALLGMSSDDHSIAGLSANYEISWGRLFQQLVNFFFSERVSVDTWDDKEIAVIKGKGCVIGLVSSVKRDNDWEDRQHVGITWKNASYYGGPHSRWTFQASAKSIRKGDAVCLLQGTSWPTIARLCNDYWTVIMIAVSPPGDLQAASRDTKSELLQSQITFPYDFLLIWNWDMHLNKSQDGEDYEHFMSALVSKCSTTQLEDYLDKVTRLWNTGVALQDMEVYGAGGNLRKAMEIFESALRSMDSLELACPGHGSWKMGDTEKLEGMVDLLTKGKDGWRPLWLAAGNGHDAIIKLLLGTGKVDPDAKDEDGLTPLSRAAQNGYETIVKLLLGTGKVDPDAKSKRGETPLSRAAQNGHETIVKLLLGTG